MTGKSVATGFELTHIIPFSLWRLNGLWNLLPGLPAVSARKLDRLTRQGRLLLGAAR